MSQRFTRERENGLRGGGQREGGKHECKEPTARRRRGFLLLLPPPTSFVHQMKTKRHDLLSAAISVTREFVLFEKCASDASLGETEERGLLLRGR